MKNVIMALVMGMVLAACAASPQELGDAASTTTIATKTTTTGATTTLAEATTSTASPTTPETTTVVEPNDVFRVAPEGPWTAPGLILFDETGARKQGHTPGFAPIVDGPVAEIAEIPLVGWVFQTELWSQVVYLEAGDGPHELLVATGEQSLALEGVVFDDDEVSHVLYQRREGRTPPTARLTLRSYNFDTGVVRELAETGGWESATWFSHISADDVVGIWGAEGYFGLTRFDLADGARTYESVDDPDLAACFDGDAECPDYSAAVIWDGRIHGMGGVPNPEGVVDAFGLYEFDQFSGTDTLLLTWPWDNGLWYVEDMFASDSEIIVSLSDGDGNPLPALVVDMLTGDSWTLPEPGFVRPGYLS